MGFKVRIPAIEKLLDYSASGIGSVAGTLLASWKARQEATAKVIAAKGEVEAQKILTEGQADTMSIIATAQADARSILVSPGSDVRGELDFSHAVTQRIQFQEEKRHGNIGTVIRQAASELQDKRVEDHEPDHDWTARFFSDIQDVSTREAQLLYGKILAGEVEKPGSTSIRTLSILRNIDRQTAVLFRILRSACMSLSVDGDQLVDARVLSLGGDASQNALRDFGLSFDNLNVLNEHGLIIADYRSWYDIRMCISVFGTNEKQEQVVVRMPFEFENRYWVLESSTPRTTGAEYRASGVSLTKAGRELLRVVECQPLPGYSRKLRAFFASQKMVMIEVDSGRPQITDTALSSKGSVVWRTEA